MLNIEREMVEGDTVVLHLSGAMTIETISEMRDALISGLKEYSHVQLDCSRVEELDFFAIQLLCSAHRTSIAWMKMLTWQTSLPEAVEISVRRTGFQRHQGCSLCPENIECMWLCAPSASAAR